MCPRLSANYVSCCPPNMAQVSVWAGNLHQKDMDVQMANLSGDLKRQNELLEDIVTAIDNKQLQIGDDDVFRSAQRAQTRYQKRTNRIGWAGI